MILIVDGNHTTHRPTTASDIVSQSYDEKPADRGRKQKKRKKKIFSSCTDSNSHSSLKEWMTQHHKTPVTTTVMISLCVATYFFFFCFDWKKTSKNDIMRSVGNILVECVWSSQRRLFFSSVVETYLTFSSVVENISRQKKSALWWCVPTGVDKKRDSYLLMDSGKVIHLSSSFARKEGPVPLSTTPTHAGLLFGGEWVKLERANPFVLSTFRRTKLQTKTHIFGTSGVLTVSHHKHILLS